LGKYNSGGVVFVRFVYDLPLQYSSILLSAVIILIGLIGIFLKKKIILAVLIIILIIFILYGAVVFFIYPMKEYNLDGCTEKGYNSYNTQVKIISCYCQRDLPKAELSSKIHSYFNTQVEPDTAKKVLEEEKRLEKLKESMEEQYTFMHFIDNHILFNTTPVSEDEQINKKPLICFIPIYYEL